MSQTPPIIGQVPASRFSRGMLLGLLLVGAGVAWLLFEFDPAQHAFYPVCFLHQATGLQCPGCGSLRACHQLLHGRVAAAWRFNPLLVSALPLAGVMAIRFLIRRRQGRDAWSIPPAGLWVALVIVVGFAIVRNLPVWPTH